MIKVQCPKCNVRLTASESYVGHPVTCQKCHTKFVLSKRWTNQPLEPGDKSSQLPLPGTNSEATHSEPQDSSAIPSAKSIDDQRRSTSKQMAGSMGESENVVSADAISADEALATPVSEVPPTPIPKGIPAGMTFQDADSGSGELSEGVVESWSSIASARLRSGLPDLEKLVVSTSLMDLFDFRFRKLLTPKILKVTWLLVMILVPLCLLLLTFVYLYELIPPAWLDTGVADNAIPSVEQSKFEFPNWAMRALILTMSYVAVVVVTVISVLWIRVALEAIVVLFGIASSVRTMDAQEFKQHSDEHF